ncbi:DNA-binding response regulator [Terrabacter tumescens]|uniref:DNA-binding response regulator n=1 Tax=Terrabacter tumescens TaxID=60443 RepID=A0ABQ2I095_9MICO|nr:response regulator [Terrabacter tumescens]GGM96762.1 DNA-binding response regulator [Terrabacter tumescens]
MTRVLVVDDDPQLARALRINLRARHHDVHVATSGAEALKTVAAVSPDLVILDLGLPDLDGVDVIHGVRGWSDVPIIVLSGRGGGPDKVAALDAGADDYVTKPFGMDELLARIRAVTRRAPSGDAIAPRVEFGDVTVDLADKVVLRARQAGQSETVHLTPTEWSLLEALVRQPGKLMSQRQLLIEVWGPTYLNQQANLRLYMTQLRRKLETEPTRPRHFLTEPGMGYRFRP